METRARVTATPAFPRTLATPIKSLSHPDHSITARFPARRLWLSVSFETGDSTNNRRAQYLARGFASDNRMTKFQTKNLFAEETEEPLCRHVIRVAFESAADTEFDYGVPDEIWPIQIGQRVEVPFGRKNKLEKGFCVESDVPFENSFAAHDKRHKLKTVISEQRLMRSGSNALSRC